MNLRPSGYEPDELPDCSTPHQEGRAFYKPIPEPAIPRAGGLRLVASSAAGVTPEVQEIAAVIFLASATAASGLRPRAGQPTPSPSRELGFGMM